MTTPKSDPVPKPIKTQLAKLIERYRRPDKISWIRTGVHVIDLLMGGGVPRGRVIEIFGSEQAGKSMLAWVIGAAFQKQKAIVLLADVEATAPTEYMKVLGVDTDSIIEPIDEKGAPTTPRTVEDVRDFVRSVVVQIREIDKNIPILIIWDSVAATTSRQEWEDEENYKSKDNPMGQRAMAMSKFFREFTSFLVDNDVTLLAVNQLRDKIGVMFGRTSESPGGRGLKYHASVRIELTRGKKIDKDGVTIGVECRLRTEKNKCAVPFRKATTRILWNHGFEPCSGLVDVLIEAGRAKQDKPGSFKVGDTKYKDSEIEKAIVEHPELLVDWTS